MAEIKSKKGLEVFLSRLKGFARAKVRDEQYITPSSIAAEVLWKAYFNGHIEGKIVADLGSGTGLFGIGCLILGAKRVYLVEKDKESVEICKENLRFLESEGLNKGKERRGKAEIIVGDVMEFNESVDTVIMNPPFGTKKRHADREFLEKAFEVSKVTYSFHKTVTKDYIIHLSGKKGFKMAESFDFQFMLRNTMAHHMKKREYIGVSCLLFEKGS